MNKTVLFTLSITLIACGGGSGGSSNTITNTKQSSSFESSSTGTTSGTLSNKDGKLSIIGNYHTTTVNSTDKTKISISGDGNMVYIQTNIDDLSVTGNSNTFDIANGVTIDDCTIIGDKNKAVKSASLKIPCTVLGTNNTGFN